MITLRRTNHSDPAFQHFCQELDKEFWVRYPNTQQNFEPYNSVDSTARVVLAYLDSKPVGCGCFRPADKPDTIEIKRMFVEPSSRGQGIAKIVLGELEQWAIAEGYKVSKLETGIKQPEAIAVYSRNGYNRIANYPPYVGVNESICMTKNLKEDL